MRFLLLALTGVCFGFTMHAQNNFESGYFLNKGNSKTECLILNEDWKDTPSSIKYKLGENSEILTIQQEDINCLEIYQICKYTRESVDLDVSTTDYNKMSPNQNPEYDNRSILLKHLIEGKATLYSYRKGDIFKFFYKIDDGLITPLIHKHFLSTDNNTVIENNYYRTQLLKNLSCNNISKENIKKVEYYTKSLVNIFTVYNNCKNSDIVKYQKKNSKFDFNLTARISGSFNDLKMTNIINTYYTDNLELNSIFMFKPGLEAELILPINNNKWGLTFETSYSNFKKKQENQEEITRGNQPLSVDVKYQSINLDIGFRYYMFLMNESKIYLGAGVSVHNDFKSNAVKYYYEYNPTTTYDTKTETNLAFSAGYKLYNRYTAEFRIYTKSDITSDYMKHFSPMKSFSLTLGYTIF